MVTINKTQKQINISIPCLNEDPGERLVTIQKGIINAIANIDFENSPKSETDSIISTLCCLLKNMQLSPKQVEKLAD